jgi:hypothetical protein
MMGGIQSGFNVMWFNNKDMLWEYSTPKPEEFSTWKNGAKIINSYIERLKNE